MLRIQRSDYPCMQRTETSSLRNAHSTADRSRTCIWFYLLRGVRCSVSSLPEFHPRTRGAGGSAPTPRAVLSRALPLPQAHLGAPPLSRSAHVTTPQKWVKVRAAAAPRRPTTARLAGGGGHGPATGYQHRSRFFCAGCEGTANAKQKFPKRRTASNEGSKVSQS